MRGLVCANQPHSIYAVYVGHHNVHTDHMVALAVFQCGPKCPDGFAAVHGNMTFALTGKDGFEDKPSGEVIFDEQ